MPAPEARRTRVLLSAVALQLALLAAAPSSAAPEPAAVAPSLGVAAPDDPATDASTDAPPASVRPAAGDYLHLMGALGVGRGVRFNNPYRLATPLGDDAESLSLTATYVDLALSMATGDPEGLQHGGSVHFSIALSGVPQEVATPSYVLLTRLPPEWLVYGRAGLPIVLGPDPNLGYELAAGGAWLATAGIGINAEIVGDLFYGAATQERAVSTIPVLSFQLGVLLDYEVLP